MRSSCSPPSSSLLLSPAAKQSPAHEHSTPQRRAEQGKAPAAPAARPREKQHRRPLLVNLADSKLEEPTGSFSAAEPNFNCTSLSQFPVLALAPAPRRVATTLGAEQQPPSTARLRGQQGSHCFSHMLFGPF